MLIPGVKGVTLSLFEMVQCVWWVVWRVMKGDWRFITEVSGGPCVMMAGHRLTRRSSAGSWASGSTHTHATLSYLIWLLVCLSFIALLMLLCWCRSGESVSPGRFGMAAGPILLDDVRCTGKEPSVTHCTRRGWLKHDCTHNQDVAIVCNSQRSRHGVPTSKSSDTHILTHFNTTLYILSNQRRGNNSNTEGDINLISHKSDIAYKKLIQF